MIKGLIIRKEQTDDFRQISKIIHSAYKHSKMSTHNEEQQIERLRDSEAYEKHLALVAILNNTIVGYVMFVRIKIIDTNKVFDALALTHIVVDPEYQHIGIATELMHTGHEIAKKLGFKAIFLLGMEDFFPKYGYIPASELGYKSPFDMPDMYFMGLELEKNALQNVKGSIIYPKEFFKR